MTTSEPQQLGDWALRYAAKGHAIFPVEAGGKKPLTDHGVLDATRDVETIRAWWSKWPESNIGLRCGPLVALDVDGPAGEESLKSLEKQHGQLPVTLSARTGRGRHLYFRPLNGRVRNSASKLGPHLDVRGSGGYTILPPSRHQTGQLYEWERNVPAAPMPAWMAKTLASPAPQPTVSTSETIPQGQRNDALVRLAGAMRRKGMAPSAIEAGLLSENSAHCAPPLPDHEVLCIAKSVLRYQPAESPAKPARDERITPWDHAESVGAFLSDDAAENEIIVDRILYREAVTELFAPRGSCKTLYAHWLAVQQARQGRRVLIMDRDNSRSVLRTRLEAWGADASLKDNLKVLSRERAPALTDFAAWNTFPWRDYDVVIVDSLDAHSEGCGEQDSSKPSRALSHLLNVARREGGPAILVLGNTIKSGAHSRGSGVVEDRADICFELRDVTGLNPTGNKPWIEELPPADASSWVSRARRRKRLEKYRLAFVPTKFRLASEPEAFIVELDLSDTPWKCRDVTDEVDQAGAAARAERDRAEAEKRSAAVEALKAEIASREAEGQPPILKRPAEAILRAGGLCRMAARQLLSDGGGVHWKFAPAEGQKGHGVGVINVNGGRNTPLTEPAKTLAQNEADFGRAHEHWPAEMPPSERCENTGLLIRDISAVNTSSRRGTTKNGVNGHPEKGDELDV